MEFNVIAHADKGFAYFSHESGFAYTGPSLDNKNPGRVGLNNIVVKGIKAPAGVTPGEYLFQFPHAHWSITSLKNKIFLCISHMRNSFR